jgi:uncharacterized membrane protein YkoI
VFIRRSDNARHNARVFVFTCMHPVSAILSCLIALSLSLALCPAALADGERDHDRARAALRAGEVLPLAMVLERVAQQQPGQVLEVELERDDGRWIYELKLLQRSGALVKLEVDARDGTVLRRKGDVADTKGRR